MKKLVFLLLIIILLGGVTGCTHFVEQDIQVAGWNYCDVNNNQMVFENIDAQIVNLSKPSDIVHSVVFYPRNYNKTIDELKDNKYFVFSHDYKIASTAVNNYYFFKDNAYYYLTTLADSANDKHLQLFSCCATVPVSDDGNSYVRFIFPIFIDGGAKKIDINYDWDFMEQFYSAFDCDLVQIDNDRKTITVSCLYSAQDYNFSPCSNKAVQIVYEELNHKEKQVQLSIVDI